ncbi:MAG: hypothetical protein HZB16_08615 [Armatimonadetes bacterium]|nr:hypothetical protein [Armatimonadota bacterium]
MDRLREWGRNPFVAAVAIGLFLIGLMTMVSATSSRRIAAIHPAGTLEPTSEGYQGLVGATIAPANTQFVAVVNVSLMAGDRIEPEMVERRASTQIVSQFPMLRSERARKDPQAPPLEGYYEKVDEPVGKFALLDLAAGMPLGPQTVAAESPLADPLDRQRPDRFTVPMPAGATLFPLLRPGDRVDVFLVVPGALSRRTLHNVRVVAVNNYLSPESGLLDRGAEKEAFGSRQEAAMRKRQKILAEQARLNQQGKAAPAEGQPPAKPAEAKAEPTKADAAPQDATKPGEAPKAGEGSKAGEAPPTEPDEATKGPDGKPKDAASKPGALQNLDAKGGNVTKAGKPFDGRAVTLQVSPAEALLLSTAMCTPRVDIEFSLRPRPH